MKKENLLNEGLLTFIKNTSINPIENMDKNVKNLNTPKKTLIFAALLSVTMMLLNLITAMLESVFVRSCDFWTGKCKTKILFENLGSVDYFTLIVKYLLMYAIFAFGVALIYYVVALLYSKKVEYFKVLALIIVAIIPNIVIGMIIGPILGILYGPLNTFMTVFGNIYTILILAFSLKELLKLNDIDKLILYSVICVVILYVFKYYIFIKLIFV